MASNSTQRIIGVCGLNASGKSTVCNYYSNKGFSVISLSDIIRQTLKERNIPETRDNLINLGNELRNNSGAGVLANLTIEKLDKNSNYVIDSIRHPDEVNSFRNKFNSDKKRFHLIGVESSPETRFQRIQNRNRIGDNQTLEQFMLIEKKEMNNPDPKGQQVGKVLEMCDFRLNNDSDQTLENLIKEIDILESKINK
ncbi:hypothetical protein DICPUDRAFT_84876 [Dictyostelium purpureum]|uniref:Dephospho-CoA kinase n=1 Tax=Dictyostelium purpureum TaxID=5786 RepID=F1A405_DICPU|nr:uncharacterized protein DICPUDRAFT_84876 [Dictyostelium purpureum]EGC29076.1 hypothetical protein DICPUDRAFT_84876 [Dictyostelium purpureum]|eukprot:XP_003294396.1 hypothetical protein DICPUDRAFT_84876 [Dictyostelium purpureum]